MTTMTKLLVAAVAIAMFAGAAQAEDDSAPDSPNWTGGYVGVVGGYGWGDSIMNLALLTAQPSYPS